MKNTDQKFQIIQIAENRCHLTQSAVTVTRAEKKMSQHSSEYQLGQEALDVRGQAHVICSTFVKLSFYAHENTVCTFYNFKQLQECLENIGKLLNYLTEKKCVQNHCPFHLHPEK